MGYTQVVKNAARVRYSARKAGIKIEIPTPSKKNSPVVEQEQPDIM